MKLWSASLVKERTVEGFGKRLREIRQRRAMTQAELGEAVGVSNRVIAYYEGDEAQPPGAMLVDLAKTLKVTSDELLGIKPLKEKASPKKARLLKRLEKVDELPPADQRAVLKFVDALVTSRQAAG
jgi:transcriptional regulator with XRE-family HTH domain